ncbi:cupin domain-containing protein [Herbiconiux sp. P15]|uniref:cupin domain-containing protein n=1 Tax=Herbiconiux liukaitaii TaxID=3342799 RepID=UPI0035BB240C
MTETRSALVPNAAVQASDVGLAHEAVAAEDVVAGSPTTASVELVGEGGSRIGLWEITPGVVTDTEADEVFVVLSGRGRVEFLGAVDDAGDGAGGGVDAVTLPAPLDLKPGTVGRLAAGTRTRWTITETLRKVYIL